MRQIAIWGTVVVLAHAVVSAVHGVAHMQVGVEIFPTLVHVVFVVGVITVAPLVAMALLWTRFRRAGALLLLVSMAESLGFGVWYHYLAHGPDHVSQIPHGAWGMVFHVTAFLLCVTEILGLHVGMRGIRAFRNDSTT